MRPLALTLLLLLALLWGLPNTAPGARLIERAVLAATGGTVRIEGLAGRFPDAMTAGRIELHDPQGAWLTVEGTALDWQPSGLFAGEIRVARLAAARIALSRLPPTAPSTEPAQPVTRLPSLPLALRVAGFAVARIELPWLPDPLAVQGEATAGPAEAILAATVTTGPTSLRLSARIAPDRIAATLTAAEPAQGPLARAGGLPDLGPIALTLGAEGPLTAIATTLALSAGPLTAAAQAEINLPAGFLDLSVRLDAPAMTPASGLSWQALRLAATMRGPFDRPQGRAELTLSAPAAQGAAATALTATIDASTTRATLTATLEGLTHPAAPPLLAAHPVTLTAEALLDAPTRPVTLHLAHPLLDLTLDATTAPMAATGRLMLPDLTPFAPDFAGWARFDMRAHLPETGATASLDGVLALTAAPPPLAALLVPEARLTAEARMDGAAPVLDRLSLTAPGLTLAASGSLRAGRLAAEGTLDLPDLTAVAPALHGQATLTLKADGPNDDIAVTARIAGTAGTTGTPALPLSITIDAAGLPATQAARVEATATLADAPARLSARLARSPDGTLRADLDRADWASLAAQAALIWPAGAALPHGSAEVALGRIEDLTPFLGPTPGGKLSTTIALTPEGAAKARLDVETRNPPARATLEAEGPQSALALRLSATAPQGKIDAAATLDLPAQVLALARLLAEVEGQAIALQAPARLDFAAGLALDRLSLTSGGAALVLGGRIAPALDLTASLRGLRLGAFPVLGAEGNVEASARLTGTTARPAGTVRLTASGLRHAATQGLPAGSLTATATLAGTAARIEANAALGEGRLRLSGTAPLDGAGALALRAEGSLPLALLDPFLAPDGRRARGLLQLAATAGGTAARPTLDATIRLADGTFQDGVAGLRLSGIQALIRADAETMRIERLVARAGAGQIALSGTVGLAAGAPVSLRLVARDATPLAADRLTMRLDSDLTLAGTLGGAMAAAGQVSLRQVDIRIPERLGTSLPTLAVRRRGEAPPPSPAPIPAVSLDLAIAATGPIFIRGRGLDAELGGSLKLGGTVADPRPDGALSLRRGSFALLGQRLQLTRGSVGMVGGSLDPTLDFLSSTTAGGTTAQLAITGPASAPKITLSSTPELPQDEILAQLVLGRSKAQLTALQIASLAAGLASLADGGTTFDPLERIRAGLGLDRLGTTTTERGDTALEAGRTVAPGVYLGVRQGAAGSGSQATVQIDIGRGVKLQADVGTASSTAQGSSGGAAGSAGITWQFDY